MKILLVGAGASWSTKDVENGYYEALQRAGHDVKLYLLDVRIGIARNWLLHMWRKTGKVKPEPTWQDVLYRSSIEALEMALRFEVDWVVVISAMYFHPDAVVLMKRAHIPIAILFTESPYNDDTQSKFCTLVDGCWTNERLSVPVLRAHNPNIQYMRHAYDPNKHTPTVASDDTVPSHDVVIVGTGFKERVELLKMINWDGIDLGLYGVWPLVNSRSKLKKFMHNEVTDNATTAAIYNNAKIGLNLHRTSKMTPGASEHITVAESMNPRAYELAACKTFQISDYRAEVKETFDGTVPTFTNPKDLEEKIRHYLAHPKERDQLREGAYQAIQGHTFDTRVEQMIKTLEG